MQCSGSCSAVNLKMGSRGAERRRDVILVPFPLHGHMSPMLQLANILHSKGFAITIAHLELDIKNVPGFSHSSSSNFQDFTLELITSDVSEVGMENLVVWISTVNRISAAPLMSMLSRMIREGKEIAGVVHDHVMSIAEGVAHALHVPSITFYSSSALTALSSFHFSQLGHVYDSSKPNELLPGLEPLRSKDLFIHGVEDFDGWITSIGDTCTVRTASAVVMNTAECLEQSALEILYREHWKVPIFAIGPFHMLPLIPARDNESNCLSWLDMQPCNSVLYVSFGSIASLDRNEFVELAESLANSKYGFLWAVRPGSVDGLDWKEALPKDFYGRVRERGIIVEWAPQVSVLYHGAVGGFLSHCGWNSTLESLAAGVPMICRPVFGDQRTNARWVSQVCRTGLQIESDKLERNEAERAIRRIMVEQEGMEMRQRAKTLRAKIESSVKDEGSSRKSLDNLISLLM